MRKFIYDQFYRVEFKGNLLISLNFCINKYYCIVYVLYCFIFCYFELIFMLCLYHDVLFYAFFFRFYSLLQLFILDPLGKTEDLANQCCSCC